MNLKIFIALIGFVLLSVVAVFALMEVWVVVLSVCTLFLWFVRLSRRDEHSYAFLSRSFVFCLTFLVLPITLFSAASLRLWEGGLKDRTYSDSLPQNLCRASGTEKVIMRRYIEFTSQAGESCIAYVWPNCTIHRMYCDW